MYAQATITKTGYLPSSLHLTVLHINQCREPNLTRNVMQEQMRKLVAKNEMIISTKMSLLTKLSFSDDWTALAVYNPFREASKH